jgi:hypothetical protein
LNSGIRATGQSALSWLGRRRGEQKANQTAPLPASLPRTCTVSIRDPEGVTHTAKVQGLSLFEAAARAVASFREQEGRRKH